MISAVCRLSLRLCVCARDWTCVTACCMCVHCINRLVLTIAAKSLRSMLCSIALPGAICPATSLPHTCSPSSSFLPPPPSPPPSSQAIGSNASDRCSHTWTALQKMMAAILFSPSHAARESHVDVPLVGRLNK